MAGNNIRGRLDRLEKVLPADQGRYGADGKRLVRIMVPGADPDGSSRAITAAEAEAEAIDGPVLYIPGADDRRPATPG